MCSYRRRFPAWVWSRENSQAGLGGRQIHARQWFHAFGSKSKLFSKSLPFPSSEGIVQKGRSKSLGAGTGRGWREGGHFLPLLIVLLLFASCPHATPTWQKGNGNRNDCYPGYTPFPAGSKENLLGNYNLQCKWRSGHPSFPPKSKRWIQLQIHFPYTKSLCVLLNVPKLVVFLLSVVDFFFHLFII